MVCGNKDIVAALAKVKSNIDSGIFNAIQRAGIAALRGVDGALDNIKSMYQERRDVLADGLKSLGWEVRKPRAAFYIWAKTIKGQDSRSLCKTILNGADVVMTPGVGFGSHGEGYVRMALTVPVDRIKEAVSRIKKII